MNRTLSVRLRTFMGLVILVIIVLTARLAWMQLVRYDFYFARAEGNRIRQIPVKAARGEIFDRNDELLAGNRPGFTVSLLGLSSRDQPRVISELSGILEMEESDILEEINRQRFYSYAPIVLKRDVTPEVVAMINERRMELPGVIIETEPIRNYEHDSLAAHVLGYVGQITSELWKQKEAEGEVYRGSDIIGISGIESTWEKLLRGTEGKLVVETNSAGRRMGILDSVDPVPGHNLFLTLDSRLQEICERALEKVIAEGRENGNMALGKGAVAILDPKSGAILAMASTPSFNPNTLKADFLSLQNDPNHPFINKVIQGTYPVGSTFKMVLAAAALEEGIITEKTLITCSGRKQFFPGEKPRSCYGGTAHGALNVSQAIAKSCNIFFFELGMRMGIDTLSAYAEDLGFGQLTGLKDLVGEQAGVLLKREPGKRWNPGDVLTAAIGQGHAITPLQLAVYTSMLVNGGTHYKPYLVQKAVNHRGETVFYAEPEVVNQLDFDENTWKVIQKGMQAVVLPGGTGTALGSLPVTVAGKTGSAEAGQGLLAHSLFVGYAPVENTEMVIAAIVEHGGLGYETAIPLVNMILSEYYGEPEVEEEADITLTP